MGKQLTKLRRRKDAKRELDGIDDRRELALVIHYSCESFYDIKDGRTPRITSIAVRNFATGQTVSFSIHKSAEQKAIPLGDITSHYDQLENAMLTEFFAYLATVPVHKFVHWNMRDINFGFQAIEHRFKVLGGNPTVVDDKRKIDLARVLIAMFGIGYAAHGGHGRMHSVMELNSISAKDALTGADEAKAFEDAEFVKLHQSTLRKVDVIANLLERTLDGSLKTQSSWFDRHGFHPQALVEFVKEHWVWSLITIIAALLALGSRIYGWL